jgi:hypothetical protein
MKNTIKLIGIIAIVAIIGFSMAACGGDDDPPPVFHGPANLRTTGGTATSVTITWDAVTDATGYKVLNSVTGAVLAESVTGTIFEITGLTAFTRTTVSVRALKGGEESQSSGISVVAHGLSANGNIVLGTTATTEANLAGNTSRLFSVGSGSIDAGQYAISLRNNGPLTVILVRGGYEEIDSRSRSDNSNTVTPFPAVRIPQGIYSVIVRNTGAAAVSIYQVGMQRTGD